MSAKNKEQENEVDGFLGGDLFIALLNFKWKFFKYLKNLKYVFSPRMFAGSLTKNWYSFYLFVYIYM